MVGDENGAPSAADLDNVAAEQVAAEATATPQPIDVESLSAEEHAALQAEHDAPKPEPTKKFMVLRSFSPDGTRTFAAGEVVELTAAEDIGVLEIFPIPPIWPADDVQNLSPDQMAALKEGRPLHDANAKAGLDSNLHDSVGQPKLVEQADGQHVARTEPEQLGPRGATAPLDAKDASLKAPDPFAKGRTITDDVDTIGNVQVEHVDVKGVGGIVGQEEAPHHHHVGPRGVNAPRDSFRG